MDAGVQITKPVSGIAMGLITDVKSGKFTVLSGYFRRRRSLRWYGLQSNRVLKTEYRLSNGYQNQGLTMDIMETALNQAREGRLHILG